jgi:hypothetical protein
MEFLPARSDSKNVSAWKQKYNTPILNITNTAYGGKDFNFSMYLNESESSNCVNTTVSIDSDKANGTLMINNTWMNLTTGKSYLDTFGLWMWVDLDCDYTQWSLWQPTWSFRACCEGCDICDGDV